MISPIHSSSITAYAQQQQEQQHSNGNQEWVDRQSSTKVSFAYSPETPLVGASTQLIFNIQDSNTGSYYRDVFARVTVTDGQQHQQQVPLRVYNIKAPNGHFSINHQIAHEGTYQIIVKVNSKDSALTLASFKLIVPFQPFGVFNINHIFPLLIPVVLVGIIGAMAILAFIIVVNKRQK